MLSIKQLQYALAIEKVLHFKKAAQMCNVSQSALSTAINELEKHLGVIIFERNNKQVLVTDEGQKILDKAQKVIQELDELIQISTMNKQPFSNPITIGVIPTVSPYLLPKAIPELQKKYPNSQLKIIEEQSHVLIHMVRTGDIDAAILALPYPTDGLISYKFWSEDFYWICHRDECPNAIQEITNEELEIDKLMLLKDGHCLKEHALSVCQLPEQKKNSDFDSASLHTLIQMVVNKHGTTLVPEMALEQLTRSESQLKAIHLNEPGPHRTIAIVIRPNYVRMNELTTLKELFIKQLKKSYLNTVSEDIKTKERAYF